MNRTKNTIGWCDFSWNPVTGCKHGCFYCYAKKLTQRFKKIFPNGFEPTFHPERLLEPWKVKKARKIFVCSISDLFASWTLAEWRDKVLLSIMGCPVKHTFQLLTKNPELISYTKFPENVWIGTTITNENEDWRNLESIKRVNAAVKFASFEPLLGAVPLDVSLKGLQWIIIGKLTGSRKVELDLKWVWDLIERAWAVGIPVFVKNNILNRFPEKFPKNQLKLQEFPREEKLARALKEE